MTDSDPREPLEPGDADHEEGPSSDQVEVHEVREWEEALRHPAPTARRSASPFFTRAQLGLRPPRTAPSRIRAEGITVHYGGDPVGWPRSHERCPSIWRAWQTEHMDTKRWADIAYSSGVCPHGARFEGRGAGVRTAANGNNDGNARSLAVVYLAGGREPLTDAAKLAFHDEAARFGLPLRWLHQEWKSTACPGDHLIAWKQAGFPHPGQGTDIAGGTGPVLPPTTWPAWVGTAFHPAGGYWAVAANGWVHTFGGAPFHGSLADRPLAAPVVGIAAPPTGDGYWLAGADGGVFSFGGAAFHGSLADQPLTAPIVGIAAAPDGKGYLLTGEDGGIFTFGSATFAGRPQP